MTAEVMIRALRHAAGLQWAKWRRNGAGDRNVYYDSDDRPMRSVTGTTRPPSCSRRCGATRARHPHHPASVGNHCDYADHDPELGAWWKSTPSGAPPSARPTMAAQLRCAPCNPPVRLRRVPIDSGERPEGFVQRALAMGRRLGFVGGGDDHYGHPGDPVATGAEPAPLPRRPDGRVGARADAGGDLPGDNVSTPTPPPARA